MTWGRAKFEPGPFYTGRFSLPIAWFTLAFMVCSTMLAMFPDRGPNPTPQTMNYTVVINIAVWGGCALYYMLDARKWFTGPKTTVDQIEEITGHVVKGGEQKQGLVVDGGEKTETSEQKPVV